MQPRPVVLGYLLFQSVIAATPNMKQCCAPVASASPISLITPAFSNAPKAQNCIYKFNIQIWQRCRQAASGGSLENLVKVGNIQDSRTKAETPFAEGSTDYFALSFKDQKIITQDVPVGTPHNIAVYEDSTGGRVSFGYDYKLTSNGGFQSDCGFNIDNEPSQTCGYCHDLNWNSTILNCFDPANVNTSRIANATCEFSC
ncbi:hypothetical protein BDV96DRAFT_666118 [Lophiotrema nucula]|uniref:Uncharacterized protein n=1 Tax=Lophiotrema nucula TaxID=690887 RepID=A0A6A5YZN6_9PLEO|nr:hypothetical protein BDV96DRAFT_666118 [Lophiotrema nucula]